MKHGLFKRSLSMVLALVMILGNVPVNALAADLEETTAPCEHSYETVVTDATCTEGGYTTHTCSLCGDTYTDGETAALGHTWNAGEVTAAATCTAEGTAVFTCTVCGATENRAVAVADHAWGNWAVTAEPTVEAEGQQTRICGTCGAEENQAIEKLTPPVEEPTVDPAVAAVQEMIDALPTSVSTEEEMLALEEAILAADDAMAELYTEQSAQLDYTNYVAALDALEAAYGVDWSKDELDEEPGYEWNSEKTILYIKDGQAIDLYAALNELFKTDHNAIRYSTCEDCNDSTLGTCWTHTRGSNTEINNSSDDAQLTEGTWYAKDKRKGKYTYAYTSGKSMSFTVQYYYEIKVSANAGGSVKYNGVDYADGQSFKYYYSDSSLAITANPVEGYKASFSAPTASGTLTVTYTDEFGKYTVSGAANGTVLIDGEAVKTDDYAAGTHTIMVMPDYDNGYYVKSLTINGTVVNLDSQTYSRGGFSCPHTLVKGTTAAIVVEFAKYQPTMQTTILMSGYLIGQMSKENLVGQLLPGVDADDVVVKTYYNDGVTTNDFVNWDATGLAAVVATAAKLAFGSGLGDGAPQTTERVALSIKETDRYPAAVVTEDTTITVKESRKPADISGLANGQSFAADTEGAFEDAVKAVVVVKNNKGEAFTNNVSYDFAKQEDGTYNVTITASNKVAGAETGGEHWTYATKTYTGIQWTVNQYGVTFVDEDGTVLLAEKKYPYGTSAEDVEKPAVDPEKTGYAFDGWTVADVTGDVTYTATYTIEQHSISFNVDGGTAVEAITGDYGAAVSAPKAPEKTGYTFVGWYADKDKTVEYTFSTIPAENITVYAKWEINTYTITWDAGKGTFSEGKKTLKTSFDYNEMPTAPEEPTREADSDFTYSFWKWNPEVSKVTEEVTYTAEYSSKELIPITFVYGNGEKNAVVKVEKNEAVEEPKKPEYEGYRFDGWYLDDAEYDFATPVTGDITLTAKWVKQVTVSFDVEGIDDQTFDINGKATKPTDPSKDQAIFGGWQLNGEDYDFDAAVTGDITLTANWLADINENGVEDSKETITITVNKANDADAVEIQGNLMEKDLSTPDTKSYVFDSNNADVTIVATPVVNGGISTTYVAGIEGAEGTGTYGEKYAYTYAFTAANGDAITVNFAEAKFTLDEDGRMRFYVGMETPQYETLYKAVITDPAYSDANVKSVQYLARTEGKYELNLSAIREMLNNLQLVGSIAVGAFDKAFPGAKTEITLGEKWLDVGTTLDDGTIQDVIDAEVGALKQMIEDGDWRNLITTIGQLGTKVTEKAGTIGCHAFGENYEGAKHDSEGNVQEILYAIYEDDAKHIEDDTIVVTLVDDRAESVIHAENISVVYRDYTEESLIAAIAPALTDAEGNALAGEILLDSESKITGKEAVGEKEITFKYKGSYTHKPTAKTITVTVEKADLSMDLPNVIATYGEAYSTDPAYTMGNQYGDEDEIHDSLIRFLIGLNVAGLDVNADGVTGLNGKVQLMLTPALQDTLKKLGVELDEGVEMSLSDLTNLLDLIPDTSLDALNQALEAISGITEAGDITITLGGGYPTDTGAYLYGAVTTNSNYETAFDVGYIVIKPDAQRVWLDWNYTDSNGIFTAELLKTVNLGASAFDDEAFAELNADATAQVQNLFFGIDQNGELAVKLYSNETDPEALEKELGYGAYTQLAFIAEFGNEMYYAVPVIRAFAMVPSVVKVDIIVDGAKPADLYTTEFDNKPVDVTANLSSLNLGDPFEVTYHYYGIEGNAHTYDSDVAPTHTGAYLITASAVAKDADGVITAVGMDVATLVIEPTESSVTMKELETVEFTGEAVNVSDAMEIQASSNVSGLKPDTTIITAGIATNGTFSENAWEAVSGTVNVDFPRWVDELIAKYAPSVTNGITVSDLNTKLLNKLPDITSKLEEVGATNEMVNSAANLIGNVGKVLAKMPGDVKLSFQDDYAVNAVGTYAVMAVVTDSDHIPSTDAGLLVIAPAVKRVWLDWNYHDENGIWSRELLKLFDLYASAYADKTFETLDEASTEKITHKFIRLDSNGDLKIYEDSNALTNGAYVELAYIALAIDSQITLSDIIARPIVIVPNDAKLQIVDAKGRAQNKFEFVFDNEPVELYVQQNGNIVTRDIRYIGLQTNGVQYDSTVAPTHAGLYAAYTVQIDQDLVGVDVALVTIAPAVSTIEVTGSTVTYDGNAHTAAVKAESPNSTVTTPDYTLISGNVHVSGDISEIGVDAFHGNVNIDFPDWLDKAMKEYDVIAYNKGVNKDYLLDFFNAHGADFLEMFPAEKLNKLGFSETDIAAAMDAMKGYAAQMLSLLEKMPEDVGFTFKNQGDLNYTEPGYYFYYGIVTDSDHIPSADTGLLVIEKMDMKFGAWHEVVPYDGKEHTVYVPNDEFNVAGAPTVDYVTMIVDRANNHVNFLLDADLMYVMNTVERLLNIEIPSEISIAALRAKLQEHGLNVEDFADALIQVLDAVMEGMEVPKTPQEYAKSTYRDLVNIKEVLSELPEAGIITINGKKPVNVGTYEFYIFAFSEYYKTQDASAKLFIEPITIVVDDEANSKIFGETDPELTAAVSYYSYVGREDPYYKAENYGDEYIKGGKFNALSTGTDSSYSRIVYKKVAVASLPEETGLSYDVCRAEGENAGTYPMSVENAKLDVSGNYVLEVVEDDTVFTIHPKTFSESDFALDGTLTYTGSQQTQGITAPEGITYEVTGNTGTDAGEYTMKVTGTGNYDFTVELPWSIAKAKVTVTMEDQTKVYGEEDPSFSYTYETAYTGEFMLVVPQIREPGEDVGTYAINPEAYVFMNDNFEVKTIPGTLTVTAKELPAADIALSGELTYNGGEQTQKIVVKVGNKELFEGVDYTVTGNKGTNADAYTMTVVFKGNYVGEMTVDWEIKPAVISVEMQDMQLEEVPENYIPVAGTDYRVIYPVAGEAPSVTVSDVTFTLAEGTTDEYVITATAATTDPNYIVEVVTGTLTIKAKEEDGHEGKVQIHFEEMDKDDKAAGTIVPNQTVEIDGIEYQLDEKGELWVDEAVWNNLRTSTKLLTTYTYNKAASNADPHTIYPTAMYVWVLTTTEGDTAVKVEAQRIKQLDNYMMYEGTSIRINFKNDAIRFFTSVTPTGFKGLKAGTLVKDTNTVLDGAKILEMGTRAKKFDSADTSLTIGNSAGDIVFGKGANTDGLANADGLRKYGDGKRVVTGETCYLFTGAMENLPTSKENLNLEFVVRPYVTLQLKDGKTVTLYGGMYQRTISYVAYQNQNFMPGTDYNKYIQKIIDISGIDRKTGKIS